MTDETGIPKIDKKTGRVIPFTAPRDGGRRGGGGHGAGGAGGGPPHWHNLCVTDSKGGPIPNFANALLAAQLDPDICDAFVFDEMLQAPMLMRALPGGAPVPEPRPLTDVDVNLVQGWFQRHGLKRLGKEATHQAVATRAAECGFHPVREYLRGLRWDQMPRVGSWLAVYLGADGKPDYLRQIGRMFLISMVARIFKPGCKVDHMLVLEGPQGAMKSAACAVLGGKWFSDALPDISLSAKDASSHLAGHWLIEVAELSAMSRAEATTLKSFLSRQVERYRPVYGRHEVVQPRQCVFVGTTNKATYLHDETGGRRYWPAKVGEINIEGLRANRDQILAEAVTLFDSGAHWWPTAREERDFIASEQEARFDVDIWEDAIREYLAGEVKTTVWKIGREALAIETARIGTAEQRRIAKALERLGFKRLGQDTNGRIQWVRGRGNDQST